MKVKKTISGEVDISPSELADIFYQMDSDEQASVFNNIFRFAGINGSRLPMQLQYVTDSKNLTDEGRSVMRLIGDYADKSQ